MQAPLDVNVLILLPAPDHSQLTDLYLLASPFAGVDGS